MLFKSRVMAVLSSVMMFFIAIDVSVASQSAQPLEQKFIAYIPTGSSIALVDPKSNNSVGNIPGKFSERMSLDPKGKFIYVIPNDSPDYFRRVLVIDTATNKVVDQVKNLPTDVGTVVDVAILPNDKAYVLYRDKTPTVFIVNTKTHTVIGKVGRFTGHNSTLMISSPNGRIVLVCNPENAYPFYASSTSVIDTETDTEIKSWGYGDFFRSDQAVFSLDSQKMLFIYGGGGKHPRLPVSLFDFPYAVSTYTSSSRYVDGVYGASAAFSSDGKRAYVVGSMHNNILYEIDVAKAKVTRTATFPLMAGIVMKPTGNEAYLIKDNGTIANLDLENLVENGVVNVAFHEPERIAFLPVSDSKS